MTEQCCGTCRYYEPDPPPDEIGEHGWCEWTYKRAVPTPLEEGDWEVYADGNRSCRVWLAKETEDAA